MPAGENPAHREWTAPRPLVAQALPAFPSAVLPSWLRSWVEHQARALQVPVDLPALLALSTVSTAVARSREVEIRRGWVEPLNIYTLVALPSGTRKSVVFEAATAPLLDLELCQGVVEDAAEDGSVSRLRLVVDGKGSTVAEVAKPASRPPASPLFVSDATPERVASLLAENAGRAAVLSDEGEICAIIAGRYGGSFEVFLKAHSGQVIAIERQGRSRVQVRRPALTLGLAVQPDVLEMLARKKALRERGLLARFLVAVPPSNVGFRQIATEPVPADVAVSYAERIAALVEFGRTRPSDGGVEALRLDAAAHEVFVAFETEVEAMLRPNGTLGALVSWGSKLAGAVARLAGLVACARAPGQRPNEVTVESVEAAIAIGRYLIPHAIHAFGLAGGDQLVADAKAILAWLKAEESTTTTQREVHQVFRRRFPRSTDTEPAIRLLVEHGYLRARHEKPREGRPSRIYDVHPAVIETEF